MDQEVYLKKLREKYDNKSIGELHSIFFNFQDHYHDAHKALISLLWYIQKQKRWRESSVYVNYSFEDYIKEGFNFSALRYRQESQAVLQFSIQCKKYGLGAVVDVIRKAKSLHRTQKVFNEIKQIEAEAGNTFSYREIMSVASKHLQPDLSKKPKGICKDCIGYKEKIDRLESILGDFRKSEYSLRTSLATKAEKIRKQEEKEIINLSLDLTEYICVNDKKKIKKDNEVPNEYIESAHTTIDELTEKLQIAMKRIDELTEFVTYKDEQIVRQKTFINGLQNQLSDLQAKSHDDKIKITQLSSLVSRLEANLRGTEIQKEDLQKQLLDFQKEMSRHTSNSKHLLERSYGGNA